MRGGTDCGVPDTGPFIRVFSRPDAGEPGQLDANSNGEPLPPPPQPQKKGDFLRRCSPSLSALDFFLRFGPSSFFGLPLFDSSGGLYSLQEGLECADVPRGPSPRSVIPLPPLYFLGLFVRGP